MILHIVLFHWKEGVTQAQIEALNQAMAELRKAVPEVKALHYGSDVGLRATGNANWGLAALFADADGWRTYQEHPAHKALLADHILPIMASRTPLQISVPDGSTL
jgi:hypothetical protein